MAMVYCNCYYCYYFVLVPIIVLIPHHCQMVAASTYQTLEAAEEKQTPFLIHPSSHETSATPSTSEHQPTLQLSFFQLHLLSDFLIQLSSLFCPSLNLQASRSMQANLKDIFNNSHFSNSSHPAGFDSIHSKLRTCYKTFSSNRSEPSSNTGPSTTKDKIKRRTRAIATTKFKPQEFDYIRQAQHNFEEMIHAMARIVRRSCNLKWSHDDEVYMSGVEKDMMYWVYKKQDVQVIFLSDYYFTTWNMLALARKCAS